MHRAMTSIFVLVWTFLVGATAVGQRVPLDQLQVVSQGHPRAFFFRTSVVPGVFALTEQEFLAAFSQLNGVMGNSAREKEVQYLSALKRAFPQQLVYVMSNASERDPILHPLSFQGHWLYFNGTTLSAGIDATETVLSVADTSVFKTGIGRSGNVNDDIGICRVDSQGRPDWAAAEQVRLVSIDATAGTITVERAMVGTTPLAFAPGSYLAAHSGSGPWGDKTYRVWATNISTTCPIDPISGLTYNDLVINENRFNESFQAGQPLALYDGIQFDVLSWAIHKPDGPGREFDVDADGLPDRLFVDDENVYGKGVTKFTQLLKQKPEFSSRFITADGQGTNNQRSFHVLNGVESEGLPMGWDPEMKHWAGALNRLRFWNADRSRAPRFGYIMFKTGETKEHDPSYPMSRIRLVFAAGPLLDYALTFFHEPPKEPGQDVGIWDELIKGQDQVKNWLGDATTETIDLSRSAPDLLDGEGKTLSDSFVSGWSPSKPGTGVVERFDHPVHGPCIKVTPSPAAGDNKVVFRYTLTTGPGDLVVHTDIWADSHPGYPARQIHFGCPSRNNPDLSTAYVDSWVDETPFPATAYWRDAGPKQLNIQLVIYRTEGNEPFYFKNMTVHNATPALIRQFENGLVLANPSVRPYTFDLAALYPGYSYQRLMGSPSQDQIANNGAQVGSTITVGDREGLFLVEVGSPPHRCGNGLLDPGETCDPPETCPDSCDDADDCTRDLPTGNIASCSAGCAHERITECRNDDGCCPAGCDDGADDDCTTATEDEAGAAGGSDKAPVSVSPGSSGGCGFARAPKARGPSLFLFLFALGLGLWSRRRR